MLQNDQQEDDTEVVPIPLDRETIARLARYGRACGKHPVTAAAELLAELLLDDEEAHKSFN